MISMGKHLSQVSRLLSDMGTICGVEPVSHTMNMEAKLTYYLVF